MDRGVHATCFYFTCLFALCTELFAMFRLASHIFFFVPCTVHSDLAYAAYSYSSGSFLTVLVLSFFYILFYVFLFVILWLCQYPVVSTLSYRCTLFVWYPCCFCVLAGVLAFLEKFSCFLVVLVLECL